MYKERAKKSSNNLHAKTYMRLNLEVHTYPCLSAFSWIFLQSPSAACRRKTPQGTPELEVFSVLLLGGCTAVKAAAPCLRVN